MVTVSKEVGKAIREKKPVVALESSVIAQGLPFPENLKVANLCEKAIRREGAVPATILSIEGTFHVGASEKMLAFLANSKTPLSKVASRDLAGVCVGRLSGGTTVSATIELAAMAGIRVFSTGGIGGVHRGDANDVSQDLQALARFPVAVVCSGAKSILDLPATLEHLETLAVPVVGVGTTDFPGFYVRETGLELEHHVDSMKEAAQWMQVRFDVFRQGGILFVQPPPATTSLPHRTVERHVQAALKAAKGKGVSGKALTPFLLSQMVRLTGKTSLKANIALLVENARCAAQIAVSDSRLRGR